jgi:hypothetical protein
MERHGLSTRAATHKAQENSKSKDDKSSAITAYLIALNIKTREIKPQFILQMDETPNYIDMACNRTVEGIGKKTIKQKSHLKSRFNVVLTIAAKCLNFFRLFQLFRLLYFYQK